jgi:hypothetical protein
MTDHVKEVITEHERLKSDRRRWERDWQDIRLLVRPYGADFQRMVIPGEARTLDIYDGTAVDCLDQLAAGLHSFLCNPVDRWFSLGLADERSEADDETLAWLEFASDRLYDVYSNEDTCFNQSIHECFLDLGSFGTGIVGQGWSPELGNIFFRSHSSASCWLRENYRGQVDTVHRELKMSIRQVIQRFGAEALTPTMIQFMDKDLNREFTVIHRVAPRKDRTPGKADRKNKAYESIWVCVEDKQIIAEGGFDLLPYHVSRWTKMAEEVYGRSPAAKCLPDIRMLNQMEKAMIKAANKLVDPVLIVENDGVLLPLKTHAGGIIFKEPGAEAPTPLQTGINLPINLEMSNQKREHIKSCFHADWIRLEKENIEMTATEVMDRREEKLRLIAPILGRQQSELLGPIIMRTYQLLAEHGLIPKATQQVLASGLKISYISPAARAQTGVKAQTMIRYAQELMPMAQIAPGIMDAIDWDKYANELAIVRGVTRTVLRSRADLATLRDQQSKTQQAQQAAQIAEPATAAVKNLADARAKGTDVSSMLNTLSGNI